MVVYMNNELNYIEQHKQIALELGLIPTFSNKDKKDYQYMRTLISVGINSLFK